MYFLNLLLFPQPSAVNETAAICVVSVVSILPESRQLPLRNEFVKEEWQESRRTVNTIKLSKERQQTVNPHYIPRLFTLSRCHQRCSLDRWKALKLLLSPSWQFPRWRILGALLWFIEEIGNDLDLIAHWHEHINEYASTRTRNIKKIVLETLPYSCSTLKSRQF